MLIQAYKNALWGMKIFKEPFNAFIHPHLGYARIKKVACLLNVIPIFTLFLFCCQAKWALNLIQINIFKYFRTLIIDGLAVL